MPDINFKPFCIEVWSDYACFTRPELKVERVSYDVPTPSAVRAVFEAIFWKPAIRWRATKLEVLNPVKWVSIRRNEVGTLMSPQSDGFYISDLRQQRGSRLLRDVRYRFYAALEYLPIALRPPSKFNTVPASLWDSDEKEFMQEEIELFDKKLDRCHSDENAGKYLAMFERRARKGQCFNTPYLGCREFSCSFQLIADPLKEKAAPISDTRDLGIMLYDLDFSDPVNPQPLFFRAQIDQGTVMIPARDSKEVLQ
ncbi:MAG TPA: type I-C CRISPR-associated protein Cas5c [bacterium]|nr:type I-C CRISPR-associated protein Cas5c [bacterium]HPG84439.1 type I-C CRISPR-associated protein Cas5c [bacterium]